MVELAKPHQSWGVYPEECREIPSSRPTPRSQCIRLVFSVLSCTEVSAGLFTPDKSKEWTPSTSDASGESWVSPGNNTSPTMKSLNGLESPACSAYWQREDFAGFVMLPAWRTEGYQNICCMVNSPLAQDPLVDQLSGIKMSANATSGLAILHLPTLKPWLLTEMFGGWPQNLQRSK